MGGASRSCVTRFCHSGPARGCARHSWDASGCNWFAPARSDLRVAVKIGRKKFYRGNEVKRFFLMALQRVVGFWAGQAVGPFFFFPPTRRP